MASFMLCLDLTPIPWILESIYLLLFNGHRQLNSKELEVAGIVFKTKLDFRLITIRRLDVDWMRRKTFAFVALHSIHELTEIPVTTFVHEMVHVLQYQRLGSLYVTEALWAQSYGGGYYYGGVPGLVKNEVSEGWIGYNMEQQAQIIEDGFRIQKGEPNFEIFEKYRLQMLQA